MSEEAFRTVVVMAIDLTRDGKPVPTSLKMVEHDNGSDAAARQGFEVARRAVLECGFHGFDLPEEKYEQWRQLELVFNPSKTGL